MGTGRENGLSKTRFLCLLLSTKPIYTVSPKETNRRLGEGEREGSGGRYREAKLSCVGIAANLLTPY